MPSPEPGGGHEAAGISRCSRRRGGCVAACGARAAAERMRRIGMLLPAAADDAEYQARVGAFLQGLAAIGLDHRPQRAHRHPLGHGRCRRDSQACGGIGRARAGRHPGPCRHDRGAVAAGDPHRTDRVPSLADPVAAGFVDSLARPGGNATGFMNFEYSIGGKWLELLKQIAPGVTRVAVLRDPATRLRSRPVWRHPGRGAVAQGGSDSGQHARRAPRSSAPSRPSRALRTAA